MDVWRSMGFYAVLLYAGLVDIPEEVIESARLDGPRACRLVRYVVLPLLSPVPVLRVDLQHQRHTQGLRLRRRTHQRRARQATTPFTLYMFNNAFSYGEYGYASTIARRSL